MAKKTPKQKDQAKDKKFGIKEGSAKDMASDAKVPGYARGGKVGYGIPGGPKTPKAK